MADEKTGPAAPGPDGTAAMDGPAAASTTAPAVAPPGNPPMTPVTPGGPAPTVLPTGKSNTIGPGVRESLEKKPAESENAGKGRRDFLKWSLPVGWVAFSGAPALRAWWPPPASCSPTCCSSRRSRSRPASPREYNVGEVDTRWKDAFGVWIVREPTGILRADRRLHAPGLLAQLAGGGEQVQVPLPRQRLLPHGHQLRGPRAAAAGARAHRAGRRRPDPGGQVGEVPAGEGRVGAQADVVPEGLAQPRRATGL